MSTASHVRAAQHTATAVRTRELPTTAVLAGLVLLSTAVRLIVGRTVPVPTIFPDELVYSELGRSVASSGDFVVRDTHVAVWTYGPLYPILIAPAYAATHSAIAAFALVKALNAAFFSLAAVPAYFLARRVVMRRASLVAAGLALLVPAGVYSTKVMAESVAYPTFLLAVLGIVSAIEQPSRRNQLLALAGIGLSIAARPQMAVLLPAFLTAILVAAWLESHEAAGGSSLPKRLAAFRVTWLVAAISVAAVLVASLEVSVVGSYGSVLHQLRLQLAPERLLWLAGDLDLYTAVVPFAAFLLLSIWALGRGAAPRNVRLFVIVVGSASTWLLCAMAAYTTAFAYVYDRYVFYLVPLLVIGLLAWIEQGLPRPKGALAVGAVALAALLPLVLPLGTLLGTGQLWGANSSSIGLVPWAFLGVFAGHGFVLKLVVLGFSVALALAVLRAHAGQGWSLARTTALLLLVAGLIVNVGNSALAQNLRARAPDDRSWIDAAVGPEADVAVVWKGDDARARPADHRFGLRQAVYFNSSVGRVYDLEDPLLPGTHSSHVSIRGDEVVLDDGEPAMAAYVVSALPVLGTRIAGGVRSGLWLYRVSGVVRLAR